MENSIINKIMQVNCVLDDVKKNLERFKNYLNDEKFVDKMDDVIISDETGQIPYHVHETYGFFSCQPISLSHLLKNSLTYTDLIKAKSDLKWIQSQRNRKCQLIFVRDLIKNNIDSCQNTITIFETHIMEISENQ